MQSTNDQLVKYMEDMKSKRNSLSQEMKSIKDKKMKLDRQIQTLQNQSYQMSEILKRKNLQKQALDRTLLETESAYKKILESSQTLLVVLKKEMVNMNGKDEEM